LSGNHIQDDGATAIADALAQNAWLMELNLSYNDIGLYGSTMLATSLARHKLIRKLDLSHNLIGSQGIYPWLGKTLRTNQSLIELRLSHNKIGDEKVCDVLAALAPTQLTEEEKIKQLMAKRQQENQRRNTIELSTLRKEEPYNKTLSTLLLDDTGISDQAAEYLSIALRENHAITHLDISSNRFGKEGNTKIAEGLEANSSLTLLNYNNVKMDEESAKVVVQALVGHRHLTKLAFQNSLHGSPTAHALGDVIRSSKTLKNIDLVNRPYFNCCVCILTGQYPSYTEPLST
jgi:Ran GTPase-activating protein (RanGAP) involved in mRNA processing and transport